MGQLHSEDYTADDEGDEKMDSARFDLETSYAEKDLAELQRLVRERGLSMPQCSAGDGPSRPMLTTLLLAYDAGVSAAGGALPSHSVGDQDRRARRAKVCPSALKVLQRIRDSPGHMGVDIGGTLVKMAIALPAAIASEYNFPAKFGQSGRTHNHLTFDVRVSGVPFVVRFVSGSTCQMEKAVQQLGLRRNRSWAGPQPMTLCDKTSPPKRGPWTSPCPVSPKLGYSPPGSEDSLVEDGDTGGSATRVSQAPPMDSDSEDLDKFGRNWSDFSDAGFTCSRPVRRIAAAGGGACKFAPLFRDALRVEIEQVKELAAVVDGLLLLANYHHEEKDKPLVASSWDTRQDADLFTIGADGQPKQLPWPEKLFPLILVNMGSGVSILRVDSPRLNDYVRVGGTACGGGTFLGLARALTSAETFEEALVLAQRGDASKADKLVRDIYGEEGCGSLGLAGNLTASNFGKFGENPTGEDRCSEQDVARSLLQMVTQQSVLLATAFAKFEKCLDRVFFVGGFVDEPNHIARSAIAANFRNLGGCAYFLRHSDFLGALGSLKCAFHELEEHAEAR